MKNVITNHVDVTPIEVACGYFRAEFDPIVSYVGGFVFLFFPKATSTNLTGLFRGSHRMRFLC